ncbi:thiamine pyrophosphate-dependent enzyme [Streptomyces sp. NPDC060223]|uniref:thiamine pyrophosphate-dependent enzyme n=1 Tax=unclassified Streptomyces TaxID=2593676 RepID=UPI00362886A9
MSVGQRTLLGAASERDGRHGAGFRDVLASVRDVRGPSTRTSLRRILGSFRHGTMAHALPHSIVTAFAEPGRQIVSMSDDGGLTMLLGELLTVAEHNLPIKVVASTTAHWG